VTWLFAPADVPRRLASALRSRAGVVIADLEDAVAPERKHAARIEAAGFVRERGDAWRVVRVNDPRFADGRADLEQLRTCDPDAVVVPKATLESVEIALSLVRRVIPLIETARGVVEAERIAALDGVLALALGSVDLAAELELEELPDGGELVYVRSRLTIAAAAAGLPAIDGVFLRLGDPAGLEAEARRARALGFAAKLCIHPAQLEPIERAFTPTAAELAQARRVVEAYEAALRDERGVSVASGQMVDLATLRRAQRLIERAQIRATFT
jgi:citrate lyase subunit beta/citryl-CoA lyase